MSEGWNHNTHYHDQLLRAVPRPCRRALDVGCGLGGFARRLAGVAEQVDAIDRDPAVIPRARALSAGVRNLRFCEADFLRWAEGPYDLISMIAALHHLPLPEALRQAASLLGSGGTLAVLGLHRDHSPLGFAASALAFPVSYAYRLTRRTAPVGAPTRDPEGTLAEIRRRAGELLPGVIIRRHLLWRYSMLWRKP
jgi:SAM-dependent methyltransferase